MRSIYMSRLVPMRLFKNSLSLNILSASTVIFRGPIFCRQCFQITLDLILSYHFIIMFIKKSLFFYYIFDIQNKNYENSMGDFWAESIRLA